jgi:predicted nuclease of restriction endonuclease-like RecB superfamily
METRKMLFLCEPEIFCGRKRYYPDFAILLPNIRRIVYLEHFGKMDSPDYLESTMDKLRDYQKYGLYLGINFFFTWETHDKPLNMKDVNQVLDDILALDQII